MNIERKPPGFRPVTITLVTREEVNAFWDLMEPSPRPRADPRATLDFADQAVKFLEENFGEQPLAVAQQEP